MITISSGGAGVGLGTATLELNAKEHGIGYDGFFTDEESSRTSSDVNHHVLFRESSFGQWTPRSLFFDCDPDCIDDVLRSDVGEMLGTNQFFSGEASAVYETRGHYTVG